MHAVRLIAIALRAENVHVLAFTFIIYTSTGAALHAGVRIVGNAEQSSVAGSQGFAAPLSLSPNAHLAASALVQGPALAGATLHGGARRRVAAERAR